MKMIKRVGYRLGLWLMRKCGESRKLEIKISDESVADLRRLVQQLRGGKTHVFKPYTTIYPML